MQEEKQTRRARRDLFARQADFSERASTRNKREKCQRELAKAISETTCLHVKQISEDEEKAASLNSNWSRASESMSRPWYRRSAAAFVRPGGGARERGTGVGGDGVPGRSFRPAGG